MSVIDRATNPLQYDLPDLDWEKQVAFNKAQFLPYLQQYIHLWKGAAILDVGSGVAWLLNECLKGGAFSVQGIEPSDMNVQRSRELFPHVPVFKGVLQDFETQKRYHLIFSIMVFVHINDLQSAFAKIYSLLEPDGEFQLIIPDFDTYGVGYEAEKDVLSPDTFAIQIKRSFGVLADIVRKVSVYESVANKAGLKLVEDVPLYPTNELISISPKYIQLKDSVRQHLLRFKKYA